MGVWQTKQTNNPLGTDFHYVVDEDDTGKEMRVVVTYIDRRGPGKSATSMETEAITADPILNAKPRFDEDEGGTQNVEEGDTGRTVGLPITAKDRDGDSLTFSIKDGAHSDKFELVVVNNTTVRLRTTQALDFETTSGPLFLQVAVHDGMGLDSNGMEITDDSIDATTTVTVTILDVEEDGVLTLSDDEPGVGTRITTDFSDGDSINSNGNVTGATWQWARSENGRPVWDEHLGSDVAQLHDDAGGRGLLPAGEDRVHGHPRGREERGGDHDGAGLRGEPAADVPLDGDGRADGGGEHEGGRERRRRGGGRGRG